MSSVAVTFKISKETKTRIDLTAQALGVDKSKVIEEAVRLLTEDRKSEMKMFLDAAAKDFLFPKRTKGYAGGPVVADGTRGMERGR